MELCWIVSLTGIVGNEAADQTRHHEGILLPYSDWYPSFKEKIFEKWKIAWQIRNEKLKTIKITPVLGGV